jgi:hypothetical protein
MLLCRELSLKLVLRLFDTYISDNQYDQFHIFVCTAILLKFSSEFKNKDFAEIQ